ncbi:site-2 protease family protein [Thermococcus gammatolerans]|uniref:Metallopeptidase, family M50 n=1 Tax=Thermococcus gammatolerans (strain DSM 15229 / JCM 11827 / EJ3) TaxID=593117 RepID=C5A5R9_THEGJ|nr:site-2 protease family protein [Thermococcus gammatolerans]ACS33581.1 Metallopeptidase, family M50 [Thermococcus gammatolerans EJ3]
MNSQELEDLLLSFLVLLLLFSNFEIKLMPLVAPAILTAFVFHELAHRWTAERYGYRAFYKRWDTGIVIALVLGLLTRVLTGNAWIFAALGAVRIYAPYMLADREAFGKIALAGPLTNIAVGVIALVGSQLVSGTFYQILELTASVNLWLAFFNLWPIPPLDGYKVLRWSAGYWAISIGVAYSLNILT